MNQSDSAGGSDVLQEGLKVLHQIYFPTCTNFCLDVYHTDFKSTVAFLISLIFKIIDHIRLSNHPLFSFPSIPIYVFQPMFFYLSGRSFQIGIQKQFSKQQKTF